jgi:hypothetical protein
MDIPRAEALDVLSDVRQWQLAGPRWQAIEQILDAMAAALEAGDVEALTAATADLELAGPLRIVRIAATPVTPPPVPIRDRLNRLVFVLGGTAVADRDEDERAGADDDAW